MLHQRFLALSLLAVCALPASSAAVAQGPTSGPPPRNVAIVIFPEVELLDFAGPGEVFSAADSKDGHAFKVYTVAESKSPVTSMNFVVITPQYTLADCPKPDIVVVPGGDVPTHSVELKRWLKERSQDTELMMSVCNGALLYASIGLLANLEVTTHHSALQGVALIEPTARVYSNRRFVDNGRVLTCAGISAGIDGALHVVSRLVGEEYAWNTARYMEYDWRPDEITKLHAQPGRGLDDVDAWRWIEAVRKSGLEAALAAFHKDEKRPTEAQLNRWGYTLLNNEKLPDALDLLRFVQAAFPTSSNASDSLSEALEVAGQKEQSIAAAKECLSRLPGDKGLETARAAIIRNAASSRVARLSGAKPESLPFRCPPCNSPCDKVG